MEDANQTDNGIDRNDRCRRAVAHEWCRPQAPFKAATAERPKFAARKLDVRLMRWNQVHQYEC